MNRQSARENTSGKMKRKDEDKKARSIWDMLGCLRTAGRWEIMS